MRQAGDGRWYWSSENFPASEVSLRTAAQENVVIVDTTPDRPQVIGEVDLFSAQTLVHEDAIYLHESVQFHVDRLDWDERKAYVRRVDVDHYTQADRAVTLKPLDVFAEAPMTGGRRAHGEVMVASLATIYKKLKFVTNENIGWGRIHLPEIELQTTAVADRRSRCRRRAPGGRGAATSSTSRSWVPAGRSRPWPASCSWSIRATSASSPRSARRTTRRRPSTSTKRCPAGSGSASGCSVGPAS